MRWAYWTVASWVMFVLSVAFWWIGYTDKQGRSWRKFLKGFPRPYKMLWSASQGWKESKLGLGRQMRFEAAVAIGIEEFEKQSKNSQTEKR